ncbi:type I-E CRISPR-associated protein Cas6/Cse3/CasE [Corynebacterium liangguodongii]|uniref:Uncharacterized protein n=1 Tax=Corynebacterium liangguodongii TaxID=2079535 RepID=A0A2S0WGA5_9CORY|nr:type I-E CRISPR-associated protein Cas6/Cse3/CasE [Corynebacterium liangguodongii]AWB84799.1 hypothetical protein C3E79_10200 [Corynebacterium liangguodongii]PWB99156.1 type I-E CRISPR-associated protein Cas6/Cse3/CasE [Corynebacterium liangguodongii]
MTQACSPPSCGAKTLITTCQLSCRARRLERDSQAMHRTLKHVIPGPHLWGVPEHGVLVVQHQEPVHWPTAMPGVVDHSHTVEVTTPITGAPITWAIIANPTRAIAQGMGKRGKRVAVTPDGWKRWIGDRLEGAINIRDLDAAGLPVARGKRHEMRTTHHRVLYTGTGTVANQARLAELQATGIGRGKAYGCGLLIVQEGIV